MALGLTLASHSKTAPASPYEWRPVFDEMLELAAVSDDVRTVEEQCTDYGERARAMGATMSELTSVVEALQLCERTHGYASVAGVLPLVEAIVFSATRGLGVNLATLSAHAGLADPGVFIGGMVEDALRAPPRSRAFTHEARMPRRGSPHLELSDFACGCRLASELAPIEPGNTRKYRAYAELVHVIRLKRGSASVERLMRETASLARNAATGSPLEPIFVRAANASLRRHGVRTPLPWRHYTSQFTATPADTHRGANGQPIQ